MGEDGAKRVVVNSVGREIRTLEEDPPTEGKRLQLTIDYDVQKAIEDGFKVARLQRRRGRARSGQRRRARLHQRAGLRSERVRRRHRSRDVGVAQHRRAEAAAGPRDPGALLARVDVQDGGRARRRSRKAIITPDFHVHCAGARELLRPRLQVLEEGRPRLDRSAPRDRAVVRRVLLHGRATWSASTRSTSGRRCSASA